MAISSSSTPTRSSRQSTRQGGCSARPGLLEIAGSLDVREPTAFGTALLDAVSRYRGGKPADDDITLLLLHHNAGPIPRLSIAEKLDVYAKSSASSRSDLAQRTRGTKPPLSPYGLNSPSPPLRADDTHRREIRESVDLARSGVMAAHFPRSREKRREM